MDMRKKSKAEQLELLNRFTERSKATDKGIEELGRLIKKGIASKHDGLKA